VSTSGQAKARGAAMTLAHGDLMQQGRQRSRFVGILIGVGVVIVVGMLLSSIITQRRANKKEQANNAVANATVGISSAGLSPASVTIQAGQTVKWTNNDTITHKIYQVNSTGLPSTKQYKTDPGGSFTKKFDDPTTWNYSDTAKGAPTYQGTVIVNG
jgi:plastocyanin